MINREQLILEARHISELTDHEAVALSEKFEEGGRCLAAAYLATPELCASELMLSSFFAWPKDSMDFEIGPAILNGEDEPPKIIRGIGVWVANSSIMTSES